MIREVLNFAWINLITDKSSERDPEELIPLLNGRKIKKEKMKKAALMVKCPGNNEVMAVDFLPAASFQKTVGIWASVVPSLHRL